MSQKVTFGNKSTTPDCLEPWAYCKIDTSSQKSCVDICTSMTIDTFVITDLTAKPLLSPSLVK